MSSAEARHLPTLKRLGRVRADPRTSASRGPLECSPADVGGLALSSRQVNPPTTELDRRLAGVVDGHDEVAVACEILNLSLGSRGVSDPLWETLPCARARDA